MRVFISARMRIRAAFLFPFGFVFIGYSRRVPIAVDFSPGGIDSLAHHPLISDGPRSIEHDDFWSVLEPLAQLLLAIRPPSGVMNPPVLRSRSVTKSPSIASSPIRSGDRLRHLSDRSEMRRSLKAPRAAASGLAIEPEVDIVVIGSGLAGLSSASLLASRGLKVMVLEQHYEIGGCAHTFTVDLNGNTVPSAILAKKPDTPVFHFEAGPSLYSGLSADASPNPLKHIFQMIGEEPEWITYDTWGAHLPEVPEGYELSIGAENFLEILRRYGGPTALEDWDKLATALRPLTEGVIGLPSTAVRGDAGILLTLAFKYPIPFLKVLRDAGKITAPFDLDKYEIRDPFLKNYLNLIAFLLQGLPADGTLTAVMAFMVDEFYKENPVMDFPKGGSGAMADALSRGVTKHPGCSVHTSTSVEEIVVENGRAVGVLLRNGKTVRARKGVISNADLYNTFRLVPEGKHAGLDEERHRLLGGKGVTGLEALGGLNGGVPLCKSFMHLHLGVKADVLPKDLPPQWTVVNDWNVPIDHPGNVIVVSMPSKLDPDLAPEGYHVIHAYTAGNEPYDIWEKFEDVDRRKSDEYQQLKEERAAPMWEAIKRRAPDVEKGVVVRQIGTPLTHARFLQRYRGNYGPAIAAGNSAGLKFPEVTTPLPGLYRCGDSTTAGIGVPAVASSGAQCANALLSVFEQLEMNEAIKI